MHFRRLGSLFTNLGIGIGLSNKLTGPRRAKSNGLEIECQ